MVNIESQETNNKLLGYLKYKIEYRGLRNNCEI